MRTTRIHINALAVIHALLMVDVGLFAVLWRNDLGAGEFQTVIALIGGTVYGLVHVAKLFASQPDDGPRRESLNGPDSKRLPGAVHNERR